MTDSTTIAMKSRSGIAAALLAAKSFVLQGNNSDNLLTTGGIVILLRFIYLPRGDGSHWREISAQQRH
jgi:hypothetical protein